MTSQEWSVIASWVDEWWPGKFEEPGEQAWFVALQAFPANHVIDGLRVLLARGGTFRPSVAEVIAALHHDASVPTFVEAYQLIYGPRGVLAARPNESWWDTPGQREKAYNDAALDRASGMHPVVGRFISRYGVSRLRMLELEDPEWGEKRRSDLQADYEQLVEALEDRRLTEIAAPRRRELGKLDPLAALGITRPALNQRTAG